MERILPSFEIEGTEFIVDVSKKELRQLDNPDNTISFDDMKDNVTHYTINYSRVEKNFPAPFQQGSQDVVEIDIPQMVQLDPIGMAQKHGITIEELQNKNDFDVIVDQKLLSVRLSGMLPKINIAGHNFIVDLRLSELRPENDFSTKIDLRNLDVSNDGEKFICFYEPSSKKVVEIDSTITELPKGVVMLEIPDEMKLDPVAVARQFGVDEKSFLRKYPLQMQLDAKVVPLSETGLPAFVKKNQLAITKQQQKPSKSMKRKKGRRL